MTEVRAGYVDIFVKVYLDDIIVYSNNREEHVKHLQLVLERLHMHGLKWNIKNLCLEQIVWITSATE